MCEVSSFFVFEIDEQCCSLCHIEQINEEIKPRYHLPYLKHIHQKNLLNTSDKNT